MRSRVTTALAVAVAVLLITPAAVFAAGEFSDVPASHPFHDQISQLAGAGVTGGCTSTQYCPGSAVNRGQMAAFLTRGLGHAEYAGSFGGTLTAANDTELNFVEVTVPGTGSGTQYVTVNASATATIASASGCPCVAYVYLLDQETGQTSDVHLVTLNDVVTTTSSTGSTTIGGASASLTWVVPGTPGTTKSVSAFGGLAGGTGTVSAYAEMTALTTPFATFTDHPSPRKGAVRPHR